MRFSQYALFLLAVSLPLYFFGFHSVIQEFITPSTIIVNNTATDYAPGVNVIKVPCETGDTYCQKTPTTNGASLLWMFLAVIVGAAFTSLLIGFAAMYLIPALMLVVFINFVVLPYSFITTSGMPPMLSVALLVIFNLITALAVADFIRGGA